MNPKYKSRAEELRKTLYAVWARKARKFYPTFEEFYDEKMQELIWYFQLSLDDIDEQGRI